MGGTSYSDFKLDLKNYLKKYPYDSLILDVGAGSGTYALLLGDYFCNIDAVEVFKPNADAIQTNYRRVFNEDIRDFKYDYYDVVIFGDVLEHLDVEEARDVLNYAIEHSKEVVVAVPYCYEQGICYGNVYEIHKQDDLTPEIMKERYPCLKLLYGNDRYGYYVTC